MIRGSLRTLARHLPGLRRASLTLRFGDLGRVEPLTKWGSQRGLPVDRWYIESYLVSHSKFVHGRVLEVKEDAYASRLGAGEVEVVDIDSTNERATVVGDLCDSSTLAVGRYDAAIVTQTLQFLSDPDAALRSLFNSIKRGGCLLVTVPCLSRLCEPADRWRWTPSGLEQLIEGTVPPGSNVEVRGLGNGLAARAFLFGLAADDLAASALGVPDEDLPLIVGACVRLPC
jgi:hypothetical protein